MNATWKPPTEGQDPAAIDTLPDTIFAFPKQRKEPLNDADHVRIALAQFSQEPDVSDTDRRMALENIKIAAEYFNVDLSEKDWRDYTPRTGAQK